MELDWTEDLSAVCAALAASASDPLAVTQAATRAGVAIVSVDVPSNDQGRWQALIEAAARQDKLFRLLKDLRAMFRERSAVLNPVVVRYQPSFARIAQACAEFREHLETPANT
jgi:hypothetical protein